MLSDSDQYEIEREVDAWWRKRSMNLPCSSCGKMERVHPERSEQWLKIWEVLGKFGVLEEEDEREDSEADR